MRTFEKQTEDSRHSERALPLKVHHTRAQQQHNQKRTDNATDGVGGAEARGKEYRPTQGDLIFTGGVGSKQNVLNHAID